MIDFIVLCISYLGWKYLGTHPLLNWIPVVDQDTGELNPVLEGYHKRKRRPEMVAFYKGLVFEKYVHPKSGVITILLRGSLHKHKNGGLHNYDDYSFTNHKRVVDSLVHLFQFDLKKTIIRHIEFAVNLIGPPILSTKLVNSTLLDFGAGRTAALFEKEFQRTSSTFKRAHRAHYDNKTYSKSQQYKTDEDIWRFECKYFKMEFLNKKGIYSLYDTLQLDKLDILKRILLSHWENTLMYDITIDKALLTKKEKIKVKDYRNAQYWIDLSAEGKKNQFSREIAKYKKIVESKSENIHLQLYKLISEKWDVLSAQNGGRLTASVTSPKNDFRGRLTNTMGSTCTSQGSDKQDNVFPLVIAPETLASFEGYEERIRGGKLVYFYPGHSEHSARKKVRNSKSNPIHNKARDYRKCIDKIFGNDPNQLKLWDPDVDLITEKLNNKKFDRLKDSIKHPENYLEAKKKEYNQIHNPQNLKEASIRKNA